MSSVKAEVLQMIQALPENCTLDDIKYRLYVRDKIQRGLEDVAQGQVLSQAEVECEVKEWLKSLGPEEP